MCLNVRSSCACNGLLDLGCLSSYLAGSMQGAFLCTEAHPNLGGNLLVLALSESLLSWADYCKALPLAAALIDDADSDDEHVSAESHVHPAVYAALAKVNLHLHMQNKVML